MDFSMSEDDEAIAETFERFFAQESPMSVTHAAPGGFDRELWKKIGRLGVPGIAVGERDGGASIGQLVLVLEAAGKHLAPVPLADSLACVRALSGSSADCYGPLCSGDLLGGIALAPLDRAPTQEVPIGAIADVVIGVSHDELVLARRADHEQRSHSVVHGSVPMATWTVDESRLHSVGGAERAAVAVDLWKILTGAGLVGLAQQALALGAEYAKERKAFGTTIASFQAVAHPLADAATACDGARLLVHKAARSAPTDTGSMDRRLVSMAFGFAVETARQCARVSMHIHGGYGASTEVDVQLYDAAATAWPICGPSPVAEYLSVGRDVLEAVDRS